MVAEGADTWVIELLVSYCNVTWTNPVLRRDEHGKDRTHMLWASFDGFIRTPDFNGHHIVSTLEDNRCRSSVVIYSRGTISLIANKGP